MTQLIAPYFKEVLSDQDVSEGESVAFKVSAQGVPSPEIVFYKDGKRIDDPVEDENVSSAASSKPFCNCKSYSKFRDFNFKTFDSLLFLKLYKTSSSDRDPS